jgi:DNA-binding NarL/FixJ family response regulator
MMAMSTVLLIDDNRVLAGFTADHLRDALGVEAIVATDCAEARAAALASPVDVILVDRWLPDGDGVDLAREFCEQRPSARLILITADRPDSDLVEMCRPFVTRIVPKPYDLVDVEYAVRRALFDGFGPCEAGNAVDIGVDPAVDVRDARHRIRNRLAAILVGLRALRLELHAASDDPVAVRTLADQSTKTLIDCVDDITRILAATEALLDGVARPDAQREP